VFIVKADFLVVFSRDAAPGVYNESQQSRHHNAPDFPATAFLASDQCHFIFCHCFLIFVFQPFLLFFSSSFNIHVSSMVA